jgi:predicted DNA-binding transcriptional regulator AlpA
MKKLNTVSEVVMSDFPKIGYMRQSEILQILPFSAATLWRKVKIGEFPKPVKLSKRITACLPSICARLYPHIPPDVVILGDTLRQN